MTDSCPSCVRRGVTPAATGRRGDQIVRAVHDHRDGTQIMRTAAEKAARPAAVTEQETTR